MATGYTYPVGEGKITTLREFALQCARGMGACIMMRDDPWDAPIPERFEPSSFYRDEHTKAQAELERIRGLSPAAAQAEAEAEREKVATDNSKYAAEKAEAVRRYETMLAEVQAWAGAPEGLKEFMTDQLVMTLKHDSGAPYQAALPPADGEAWRAKRLSELSQSIGRYGSEYAKEVERTESRNAWLAQLRASLPAA